MWRVAALFRIVWRTVRYSVLFGTPGTVIFVLITGWQSYGSYGLSTYHTIIWSLAVGAIGSAIFGLIFSIVMVATVLMFFPRIEDGRRFRSIVGLAPFYILLVVHVLLNTVGETAAYFRLLANGPAWIKLHFMAFLIALAGAVVLCRHVAGKYATEVAPRKRKQQV